MVPVKTMLTSAVPSPLVKDRPEIPLRVRTPLVTERVTLTGLVPASGSEIEIALPLAEEKTRELSSLTVWAPGTVLTGGWLGEAVAVESSQRPRPWVPAARICRP